MKKILLEELGQAYLDLLKIDQSPAREHAQRAMAVIRDTLAERLNRTSEDIQGSFEEVAADFGYGPLKEAPVA